MHMRYSVAEDINEAIDLGFEAVKLARIRTAVRTLCPPLLASAPTGTPTPAPLHSTCALPLPTIRTATTWRFPSGPYFATASTATAP